MDGLPFPAPLIEDGAGSFLLRSLRFLSVVDEGAVELVLHFSILVFQRGKEDVCLWLGLAFQTWSWLWAEHVVEIAIYVLGLVDGVPQIMQWECNDL